MNPTIKPNFNNSKFYPNFVEGVDGIISEVEVKINNKTKSIILICFIERVNNNMLLFTTSNNITNYTLFEVIKKIIDKKDITNYYNFLFHINSKENGLSSKALKLISDKMNNNKVRKT